MLDRALDEAGIERSKVYVTNAVKHFKFAQRGKRRRKEKTNAGEIEACRWWIEREIMLIKPDVTVAMGATAARALFGRPMTIGRERGRAQELPEGGTGWVTVHPSRSEEHTSELQSLMRISYAVFCLKKKKA